MKKFTLLLSAMLLACATSLWAETYTIEFLTATTDGSTEIKSTTQVSTVVAESSTAYVTGFTNCSKAYYKGVSGVKVGSGKANGTFEFTLADVCKSNVTKITVKSAKYGSDTGTLSLYVNGGTELKSGITPGTDYVHTFATAQAVSSIKLTTSANRAYVSSIIIETGAAATLQSIQIAGEPTKTTYMAGDAFSTDGLKVMGNYDNATQKEITTGITWEVTPATLTAGQTQVEVKATVGEKSTTRTITGLTVTAPKTLTSIAVSGTPAEFWKGDTFHHDGMTVTANWDDDTHTDVTAEAEFSTPDMATAGTKTVTVTYKEKTATYDITVKTIANNQETAYTVAEAIALIDEGKDLSTEVFVKGIVSEIVTPWSDSFNNITYSISDDGATTSAQFQLFRCVTNGASVGDAVIAKGVMKKYGTTYEFDAGNEIVYNATPTISCEAKVAFGDVSSLANPAPQESLQVTAINLTEAITATLSEGAAFTLSTTTLPAEGGTLIITPVLTVGKHTATLTLTSGETSVKVALSATIQQAYTISWSVNGKVTSTSAVIDGENLVLPAAPEAPNECASKVFVGWATSATVAADGTDIVFVDAVTPATADATYYAVFARATETGEPVTTYEKLTSAKDFEDGTYLLVGYVASSSKYYAYTGKVINKNFAGVVEVTVADNVIATKPETALELTITTNAEGEFSIYDGTYWLSAPSANELTFNANETVDWQLTEDLKIQSVGETSRYLQFNGGANPKRFACYTGTQSDPSLFKKVVTSETEYSEYATTCDDTPSAIESAAVETPAVKTIENGQLIILRDGVKYNAMGVRLQ